MAGQALLVTERPKVNALPTEDQIRQRAHEIYLARGAAEGQALEDWLAAEAELRQKSGE